MFLAMDISLAAIVPHKEAAIALAADRLAEKADIAYGDVKNALTSREALGSTALGRGVAIPHAMARTCLRPACALISLARPVNFDAPDHMDVDVVLALIWPKGGIQDFVRFSALANRVLSDPVVLDAVRAATAPDRIRSLFLSRRGALQFANPLRIHTAGHGPAFRPPSAHG
jgi:PTS system nitrogen regulatory IIA component